MLHALPTELLLFLGDGSRTHDTAVGSLRSKINDSQTLKYLIIYLHSIFKLKYLEKILLDNRPTTGNIGVEPIVTDIRSKKER